MGVFDKIKNIFFEEEYVEVEEEEKPKVKIAKKIELPEAKKEYTNEIEEITEEEIIEEERSNEFIPEHKLVEEENSSFKFPMDFEEDDFKVEQKEEEKPVYQMEAENKMPYGQEKPTYGQERAYTPYTTREEKKDKPVFRPTPIISPIYGILDKNYKKEEIVSKKETRLTTAINRKMDVDSIREKAFGDLASDITESMEEIEIKEEERKEDSLYDLNDGDHPVVEKVTVGDAEEYFSDLGLEYNVDYKDSDKEKASNRRVNRNKKLEEETNDTIESNLFDLIDSMYENKEE